MNKKLIISTCILLINIFFTFSMCFADDATNMLEDATDSVRNVVGDVENAVEDAAGDVTNSTKNATEDMEEEANDVSDSVTNTMGTTDGETNDNSYTATRTSTDAEAPTFMGMTATAWTWLIMGIVAIAIVALVWYYANQIRTSKYDD